MNLPPLAYLHALRTIPEVGNRTIEILLERFGSSEAAWQATESDILNLSLIKSPKTREHIVQMRRGISPYDEWQKFLESDITLLSPSDSRYPKLLKEIPDYPQTLYVRGNFDWTKEIPMIAIVGSRKFTAYGEQVATRLSEDLTHAGMLVVSGLAFGIDSIAHTSALESGGETIAVLGSGLARISPTSHIPLAEKIMGHGAVISEYPPFMEGAAWTFPVRDRIIAGLTLGTIVIEAGEKSGSLITAQCALEYNREVFAVPGSIFSPYSFGTNNLIKKGAKVVMGIQDILEELSEKIPLSPRSNQNVSTDTVGLFPEEQKVLSLLSHEPVHIDKIIKASTLQTAAVSSLLGLLEIKGLAKNVGGMHYIRV